MIIVIALTLFLNVFEKITIIKIHVFLQVIVRVLCAHNMQFI